MDKKRGGKFELPDFVRGIIPKWFEEGQRIVYRGQKKDLKDKKTRAPIPVGKMTFTDKTEPYFIMSNGSLRRAFFKLKGKGLVKRAKRVRMAELNERKEKAASNSK